MNVTGLGVPGALPGDADTAVELAGADDFVAIRRTFALLQLSGSFSIELWVKLTATSQSDKYLLNKGNHYAVLYG